jgi:hypothetical protein
MYILFMTSRLGQGSANINIISPTNCISGKQTRKNWWRIFSVIFSAFSAHVRLRISPPLHLVLFNIRSLSQSTSYEGSTVDKEAAKKGSSIRRERAKKLKGSAVSGRTPDLVYHYCPQCMFTPVP